MIFSHFANYQNLKYGFSDRKDGSMNRRLGENNRERYFRKVGINPGRVITADLVHDSAVAKVSDAEAGTMVEKTDGLVTESKNLFLSATAADCFLIYFYNPTGAVIGIIHAGWRSLIAGVVENAIDLLLRDFSAAPRDILVGVGPGIRKCHFEISPVDSEKFQEYSDFTFEKGRKIFVSLPDIIKTKLSGKDIPVEQIEDAEICTYCSKGKYFSYRRDKPQDAQLQVGYIGLV